MRSIEAVGMVRTWPSKESEKIGGQKMILDFRSMSIRPSQNCRSVIRVKSNETFLHWFHGEASHLLKRGREGEFLGLMIQYLSPKSDDSKLECRKPNQFGIWTFTV